MNSIPDNPRSDAELSPCGNYRYTLGRSWADTGPRATFLMLNPSTADASFDDPTIRKCCGFARRLGYSGIWVLNLFAFRATDPRVLVRGKLQSCGSSADWSQIVGPENDSWLRPGLEDDVICAWGSHSAAVQRLVARRWAEVAPMVGHAFCLGTTKSGAPRHPLMLPYSAQLQPWSAPVGEVAHD